MKVFINEKGEIKDVGFSKNESLTEVTIDDEHNPFKDWCAEKICCYKVIVTNGVVTSMTPYIDTRIIEHLDRLDTSIANLETALIELTTMVLEMGA